VGGLGLVAGRSWRAYAAPAALLLAVTVAVVLLQSSRHATAPAPRPTPAVSKRHVPPTPRFYRVRAGDTLAGIATKTKIPLLHLRTLNPSLQPTALFIGEKIRLR
jgi:LysM repeat protein